MGKVKKRVLVIGMDSAPLTLLNPWTSKGKLPTLQKIFRAGSVGDLYSRIPVTPIAWSSIYTGKNPAKHGILGFRNHKPNSYDDIFVNSTLRDARDLWEIAGEYGKKVVVVNTPITYPARPVNGYLVCGFMAPGTKYSFTYPESLSEEIRRTVPGYRIGTAPSYIKSLYLKELHKTVQMVGEASVHLLKKIDWDLAFLVFKETDEVQHSFYDKPESMLGLYQRVDKFAGRFLEIAGPDCTVLVVSDHGGEPIAKRFNVAEYLRQNGLIRLRASGGKRTTSLLQLVAQTMFQLKLEWMIDIPGSRKIMSQLMKARARVPNSRGNDGFYAGKVDWSQSKVFISSGIGIRINLKGREPLGFVEPDDYPALRAEVAKQFSKLQDPENGDLVFKYALPREEILSGPHLEEAPDILCLPNTGYLPTEALASFDPIAVAAAHRSLFSKSTLWCGTHSPQGLVAIAGPGVIKTEITGATLDDIAPTALYALGLPIPRDMDGRVLVDAFSEEFRSTNVMTWEKELENLSTSGHALSSEEESIIEDRLKALGYLS